MALPFWCSLSLLTLPSEAPALPPLRKNVPSQNQEIRSQNLLTAGPAAVSAITSTSYKPRRVIGRMNSRVSIRPIIRRGSGRGLYEVQSLQSQMRPLQELLNAIHESKSRVLWPN